VERPERHACCTLGRWHLCVTRSCVSLGSILTRAREQACALVWVCATSLLAYSLVAHTQCSSCAAPLHPREAGGRVALARDSGRSVWHIGRSPPGAHSRVSNRLERHQSPRRRRRSDAWPSPRRRRAAAGASCVGRGSLSRRVEPPRCREEACHRHLSGSGGSAAPVRRAVHPRAAGAAERRRKRPLGADLLPPTSILTCLSGVRSSDWLLAEAGGGETVTACSLHAASLHVATGLGGAAS
jgi:hypothetical protein